ncbi:MAG: hypothetical protein PHV34_12430 [Verrucomicrobiae bacterium]|nr:hypothetical protein [Verrucomicrobiae bacterium]
METPAKGGRANALNHPRMEAGGWWFRCLGNSKLARKHHVEKLSAAGGFNVKEIQSFSIIGTIEWPQKAQAAAIAIAAFTRFNFRMDG